MPRPRILIADDHPLIAEGLSRMLSEEFDVLGVSPNGRALLTDAIRLRPDVVCMDVSMPELNGIEAALQLRAALPGIKIVFVTQQLDAQYLRKAFRVGAMAYVAKQSAPEELTIAVRTALNGAIYITPILEHVVQGIPIGELRRPQASIEKQLTPRQREVLQLVAEGKTIKQISAALNISPKTVEFHKTALMNEVGLRTTAELTRYAVSRGFVSDPLLNE